MLNKLVLLVLILSVVVVFAGIDRGKAAANTANTVYKFEQELEGEIAGKPLKPGTYKVVISNGNGTEGKLTILKSNRIILETPCKVEKIEKKLEGNSVVYGKSTEGRRYVRWLLLGDRQLKVTVASEESPAKQAVAE